MTLSYEQIKSNTILLCEYGSRSYGITTDSSDHDLMGVTVEPQEYVLGLKQFEQYQSTNGVRSTADDTDETIYSLRKWAGLAAKGNPTVQMLLFAPEHVVKTDLGQVLVTARNAFISKEAGHRYLGYMNGQRLALMGEKNKRTNRPELIEAYGYDTKFAYHMLRLGYQGIELMKHGEIQLPIEFNIADFLSGVRAGRVTLQETLDTENYLFEDLKQAIKDSALPDTADYPRINQILADIYTTAWRNQ